MKTRLTANQQTLGLLLILTALVYLIAESRSESRLALGLVLAALLLKFSGITFVFMGLQRAHWLWRTLSLVYVACVVIVFAAVFTLSN